MAITIQSQQWESGEVISATKLNAMVNDITALGTNSNNLEEKVTTKALTVQGALETTSDSVDIKKATNIAGTTTITGDFEVKSDNNTILKAENASNILKVSIPNQLIVGTANTENDTTTYVGTTTFNTETTQIHGTTTIDKLTAANVTGSAEINGNLTVGTANTENNTTTYAGTAIFNTAQTQIHGITTIDTLSAANITGNASIDGAVIAKDGLVVGTATQAKKAKVFGTLETTGNTTIRGTLETHDNTTINGDLTVSGTYLLATRSVALLGRTTIGDNVAPKDLRVYGTTTTDDLVVNNKITTLAMGTTNIDNLTVGTPEITENDVTTPATGITTLYGSTTITSLKAETTNIDTLTVGTPATVNANNETVSATGETILHGIVTIDNLTLLNGITVNNNGSSLIQSDGEGITIAGTTVVDTMVITQSLNVNKINNINLPTIPIDEDSLEEVKPYKDGIYTLQLTITNGQPSYSWVVQEQQQQQEEQPSGGEEP